MAVLRKARRERYTIIDNEVFLNTSLSLKAKGLLCQMLSLPDEWEYSIEGLATLCSDGKASIATALKELEDAGYFRRIQVRDGGKMAGVEYVIYESPITDFPLTGNPSTEKPLTENQPQYNTKESNTNKSKTKRNIFVPPTVDEVEEYINERGYAIDAETFVDFYTSKNWYVGKTKMVDWKASVRYWASKRKGEPKHTDRPRDFNDFL